MSAGREFDAIVVGSGFAGAVTACRLSEAGKRVCILERGRRYLASDLPVLGREPPGGADRDGADRRLPDLARAFWKLGQGLWDLRDLGELVVAQAAGYGGGSLIYANVHLRAPERLLEGWPEPYRDREKLQPFYDLAAYMLDVQTMPRRLPKAVQLRRAATALGRQSFDLPLAVNFGPREENRFGVKQGVCDMGGECCFGCSRQAKNTLDLNYLALAEQRGAEVRTLAEVVELEPLGSGEGYEVRYRDHLARGRLEELSAPCVFLCAGALNTTELLVRNREAGRLEIRGEALGSCFHPNADAVAVAFDCDEPQESDRGPTITSSLVHDDGESFLLVQDGGMPAPLEPLLGIFRSPLWLHRNGFEASPRETKDAARQKPAYAKLPFDSLADVLSTLTGSAITATLPLAHDVSQALLAFARGGRELALWQRDPVHLPRSWALVPAAARAALEELRARGFDDVALAAEPVVEELLRTAASELARGSKQLLEELGGRVDLGNLDAEQLAEWALRLGVQLVWGSQAGLVGGIAQELRQRLLPEPRELLRKGCDLLRWGLDYRLGDGNSAVLLSMGRDSRAWRLALERPALRAGGRVVGAKSGAAGILVGSSEEVLVLADVRGRFEKDEWLLAGERAFGVCASDGLEELPIARRGSDESLASAAAELARLGALRVDRLPLRKYDDRRFRTDAYRKGRRLDVCEEPPLSWRPPEPPLRAHAPDGDEPPERQTQELLLRDIARELRGELRTDPVAAFLERRVTVHAQGGCPMAEKEAYGVTDPYGRVFGCPGLYVMDAAAFPTPVGVNPSATIAAVAEFKVARFLSENWGEPGASWTAREQSDAIEWAAARRPALDPLGALQQGWPPDRAPDHEPIGIEFTEVMEGTHRGYDGDGPEREITTRLTVTIPDLASLLATDRRGRPLDMQVDGTVQLAGVGSMPTTPIRVSPAGSHVRFSAGRDAIAGEWRAIEYQLVFAANGRTLVLRGIKDIRDDERFDLWEDTTTLTFTLADVGQEQAPFRRGVLRLPAAEFFGGQLPSLRVTHADHDPARQVWAFSSFVRFFFSHLVDVYVPELDRVVEVGREIARRGHG